MSRASAVLATVGIAGVLAMSTVARADPKPSPYKLAYERGQKLSAAGDWPGAREAFLAAYAMEHRPINLYNIATTYWHERDLEHAGAYYQRFLDEASPDDAQVSLATERLTEIKLALVEPDARSPSTDVVVSAPAPLAVSERYPRDMIERPPTLLAGMVEVATGVAATPRFVASSGGQIDTTYEPTAVVGLGVGVTSWLELRGELDVDLQRARGSLASTGVAVAIVDGDVTASAVARLSYELDTPGLYDARLAVPIRIRLTRTLAVISSDDVLVLTLDDDRHRLLLRLPVGVAYQFPEAVYAWLATQAFVADLRESSLQTLLADYKLLELGVGYAPTASLDVALDVRASDLSVYASIVARLRL